MTAFLKMHGLGNDFVVFDARNRGLALEARMTCAIANRRTGIGCDQVIVIARAVNGADAAMRIFNADGGEVESCGNAARCVAQILMQEKHISSIRLDTEGGSLLCSRGAGGMVSVDMSVPRFEWADIPLAHAVDTKAFPLQIGEEVVTAAAVSVGNPHCVIFVNDAKSAPVGRLGPKIETHDMFPARVNAEFVQVLSHGRLRMRVWERGVGITQACGTGACASAVAAARRGLAARKVEVMLDGGTLAIEWRESDGHVLMTGPTALSFRGDIDLAAIAP